MSAVQLIGFTLWSQLTCAGGGSVRCCDGSGSLLLLRRLGQQPCQTGCHNNHDNVCEEFETGVFASRSRAMGKVYYTTIVSFWRS